MSKKRHDNIMSTSNTAWRCFAILKSYHLTKQKLENQQVISFLNFKTCNHNNIIFHNLVQNGSLFYL